VGIDKNFVKLFKRKEEACDFKASLDIADIADNAMSTCLCNQENQHS
jgi:hypothetical protein